jgi:hypothetical protein
MRFRLSHSRYISTHSASGARRNRPSTMDSILSLHALKLRESASPNKSSQWWTLFEKPDPQGNGPFWLAKAGRVGPNRH